MVVKYHLKLWPPSVNQAWRYVGGRAIKSSRARKFKEQALWQLSQQRLGPPLKGDVWVTLTFLPPDRRRRDVDNLSKHVLDVLTAARVWLDDSQVTQLTMRRSRHIVKGGQVFIEICDAPAERPEAEPAIHPADGSDNAE